MARKQPTSIDHKLAANIARARKDRGESQIEFAKKVGTSCAMLNQIENAERPVTTDCLWNIAEELGVSIDTLLE